MFTVSELDTRIRRLATLIMQPTTTPTDREEIKRLHTTLLDYLRPRMPSDNAARAALDAAVRAALDAASTPAEPQAQMTLNL